VRLALEVDPSVISVEAIDMVLWDLGDSPIRPKRLIVPRGATLTGRAGCTDDDGDGVIDCPGAIPTFVTFAETDEKYVLIDIATRSPTYGLDFLREIGKLRVRVKDDAPLGEILIKAAQVPVEKDGEVVFFESGGEASFQPYVGKFQAANEVREGKITIEPRKLFLRGDANENGSVELADAIAVLNYLFLSGKEPGCLDTADGNDDGSVDLGDGIFILFALFEGLTIPEPSPACGRDRTADALGCKASTCEEASD